MAEPTGPKPSWDLPLPSETLKKFDDLNDKKTISRTNLREQCPTIYDSISRAGRLMACLGFAKTDWWQKKYLSPIVEKVNSTISDTKLKLSSEKTTQTFLNALGQTLREKIAPTKEMHEKQKYEKFLATAPEFVPSPQDTSFEDIKNPKIAFAHTELGRLSFEGKGGVAKSNALAQFHLTEALKQDPQNPTALYLLAQIQREEAKILKEQGNVQGSAALEKQAETSLSNAKGLMAKMILRFKTFENYLTYGKILMALGTKDDLLVAKSQFFNATKADPRSIQAHELSAECMIASFSQPPVLGEVMLAATELNSVILLNPKNASAYKTLAQLYSMKSDMQDMKIAEKYISEAQRLDPKSQEIEKLYNQITQPKP